MTAEPLTSNARIAGLPGEEWWRRAVVYQIYPRSFADSDGDGMGDLRGIIEHLDHLEYLGIDVIWLSPIYRSPHDDNGYDISDYRAIDPVFGTLADFDELIAKAHDRGIRIVMDLVVNHTSDEHPWFVESASEIDSPKRDWYWWRDGSAGGALPPNNWGSFFSGSAWARSAATGQYYLHLFSPKQPDLNWENPEVRRAIYEMMRWWLDRGVDGFRMDVINLISKNPELPDGEVPAHAAFGEGAPYYAHGPRLGEYLQEMNREVFAGRPDTFLKVGEMPGVTVELARILTDPERGEMSMVFQFEHVSTDQATGGKWFESDLSLPQLKASFARWQTGLHGVGWNSLYWNNHDQPRVVSRYGTDGPYRERAATALATVLHLQQGTPYVYQGEEIGMTNILFSDIDQVRDIESRNFYSERSALGEAPERLLDLIGIKGRDNARTPVQWDASANAGFSTGSPWISVNPNHTEINVASQRGRPGSILEFYRALIRLRHEEAVITDGDFRLLSPADPALFAFVRSSGDDRLLVLANLSGTALAIGDTEVLGLLDGTVEVVIGNLGDTPVREALEPWQAVVLRLGGAT